MDSNRDFPEGGAEIFELFGTKEDAKPDPTKPREWTYYINALAKENGGVLRNSEDIKRRLKRWMNDDSVEVVWYMPTSRNLRDAEWLHMEQRAIIAQTLLLVRNAHPYSPGDVLSNVSATKSVFQFIQAGVYSILTKKSYVWDGNEASDWIGYLWDFIEKYYTGRNTFEEFSMMMNLTVDDSEIPERLDHLAHFSRRHGGDYYGNDDGDYPEGDDDSFPDRAS